MDDSTNELYFVFWCGHSRYRVLLCNCLVGALSLGGEGFAKLEQRQKINFTPEQGRLGADRFSSKQEMTQRAQCT